MNYRIIAKIGCKLLALMFFINYASMLIGEIVRVIYLINSLHNNFMDVFFGLLMYSIILVFCLLLWVYADKIASLMIKEETVVTEMGSVDYDKLLQNLILFGGIMIIFKALPIFASNIYQFVVCSADNTLLNNPKLSLAMKVSIINQIINIAIGLYLLLCNKRIVNGICRIRISGIKEAEKID